MGRLNSCLHIWMIPSALGECVVRGGTPGFLVLATRSALIFVMLRKCFVSAYPFVTAMSDASLSHG